MNLTRRPRRRQLRLRDYDYAEPGAYFITLCSHQRLCLFGTIRDGMMVPNSFGQVVAETRGGQTDTPSATRTDEWVLMPNHFHAIVLIESQEGGSRTAPTRALGTVVNALKTVSAKRSNQLRGTPGTSWHRL